MEWITVFTVAGSALFSYTATAIVIPVVIAIANKFNIVDAPDGRLKNHKQPTPYLGGIAVYIGFISALSLLVPVFNQLFFIVIGATLLLFVGLIDDLIVLTPKQKFYGQLLATCCFLRGGFYLKEVALAAYMSTGVSWLLMVISCIWILAIINAVNLLDVMDGLATTVSVCVASSLACIALITGSYDALLLLMALIGSLIAFLQWNRPPARIYLGDAGSLFIGGILAIAPFAIPWGTYHDLGFLTPIILFFIPLIEVSMLILIRTARGIPWYKGSPDHFCLYLKRKEWRVFDVLLFVFVFSGALLLFGTVFFKYSIPFGKFMACGFSLLAIWMLTIFLPKYKIKGWSEEKSA